MFCLKQKNGFQIFWFCLIFDTPHVAGAVLQSASRFIHWFKCHVSHVTCHIFVVVVVLKLIGGGSVINGAYPVQFLDKYQFKHILVDRKVWIQRQIDLSWKREWIQIQKFSGWQNWANMNTYFLIFANMNTKIIFLSHTCSHYPRVQPWKTLPILQELLVTLKAVWELTVPLEAV